MRGIGNDLVFLCSGKEILARHDVVCTQAKTLYPTHVAEGLKTEVSFPVIFSRRGC